jgi:hypothetical protein
MDQRRAWSMVDQPPWPAVELIGAQPSSRSGPRWLAARWGKEGGHHRESILASTEAWKGDDVGTVRAKRRRVGGVGIFIGGGATFYRAEVRRGRPGAFNGRC